MNGAAPGMPSRLDDAYNAMDDADAMAADAEVQPVTDPLPTTTPAPAAPALVQDADPLPDATAAAPAPAQGRINVIELLAEQMGVSLDELRRQLREELGEGDYDPRDLQNRPLRFFLCTKTHSGPVRMANGLRQLNYRHRPNAPLTEVYRMWVKGRIYPFRSTKQLPERREPVWETDPDTGQIKYMEDPQAKGDPSADLIPVPKMETDPATGKRHQVYRIVAEDPIAHFTEQKIPQNQIIMFLHGAGFQQTRIENPISAARIEGNFVRKGALTAGRNLSVEEKARMAEREAQEAERWSA